MGNLKEFLADSNASVQGTIRKPATGKKQPKSNYVALGLVFKNMLPDIGANYTPAGGGTPTPLTGSNIASAIKGLCVGGQAYFFGNGTVNGKKGKPEEWEESVIYGTRTVARKTGEITDKIDFDFKFLFNNVAFFNTMRAQGFEFDVYVFTDKSVQVIRFDINEPTYHDIGHTIEGDIKKDIAGSFSVTFSADGELEPTLGVLEQQLADSDVRLQFGPAVATAPLTAVAGTPDQYKMVTGTAGVLNRPVSTTGAAGVQFYIFKNKSEDIPAGVPVTIDTVTGKVTFGAAIAVGRYVFNVVAENQTGVRGEYPITLDVTAS